MGGGSIGEKSKYSGKWGVGGQTQAESRRLSGGVNNAHNNGGVVGAEKKTSPVVC